MKLALGTVQFGIDYGAFNSRGQVPPPEVAAILDRAGAAGVQILDTARAYGTAEEALALARAPARFEIVTKCPPLRDAADPARALQAAFDASCAALGVTCVHGYLMHDCDDILRPGVWPALERLQSAGRIAHLGVSAYDPADVARIHRRHPITLAQLPANVLNPWFTAPALPETVELHVRSAFLQGFLLSDPDRLPARFQPWRETLVSFRDQARAQGLSPLEGALAPLLTCRRIAQVVVGVESLNQLEKILSAASVAQDRPDLRLGPFPDAGPALTDPRRWTG